MDRIRELIEKLKSFTWAKIPYLPAIEQYLQSGDPAALKKVTPAGAQNSWWGHSLANTLRPVGKWDEVDRRLVHVLYTAALHEYLWRWVDAQMEQEKAGEDAHGAVRHALEAVGAKPGDIAVQTVTEVHRLAHGGRPTSAGRFLLGRGPDELRASLREAKPARRTYLYVGFGPFTELLTVAAADRLGDFVDDLLQPKPLVGVVKPLLDRTGDTYLSNILRACDGDKDTWNRFRVSQVLYAYDPVRFRDAALAAARASLKGDPGRNNHGPVGVWMVASFGAEVLPDLLEYFASKCRTAHWANEILDAAVAALGGRALPLIDAAIDATGRAASLLRDDSQVNPYTREGLLRQELQARRRALQHLIALNDPGHDPRIAQELRRGLAEPQAEAVVDFLNLAGRWKPQRLEQDVWGLLQHKSKPVRGAAARALAKLGDAALPQARELLGHKKADVRGAAVTLLAASGTAAALADLEANLEQEANEDVRDEMLLGLAAAWSRQGRVVTRQDVQRRIDKAADRLANPPAKWADLEALPPLYWKEGGKLSHNAVAYLLHRQSRSGQIRADVEAQPMYALLDRSRAGEFAAALLRGFLRSKQDAADRWTLAVVGLLGDDRVIPDLTSQIRDWVEHNRGKLAEYAVQALALLGSDSALLAVDAMDIRYRSKMKNVGRAASEAFVEAARAQGITPEELGDRVVPWLGFEPGKTRVIECGNSRIEAGIGMDLKLCFKDVRTNKPLKSLPKTAPKEVLQEFKDLSANLREIAKAQLLRLENLLVRQRRWPVERWRELFLHHPLLLPFAVRMVWGHYDGEGKCLGAFRALEDRTLSTAADEVYQLPPGGEVGVVHPLELSADQRQGWQNHLVDYEIQPPFAQSERRVVRCTAEQAPSRMHRDLRGTSVNAMTFKGRAERLGWYRGSVCDGGVITSYHKSFPASGTDVFLALENFYMGIDMYSSIKLGDVCFVKHGSVQVGSYTYDEPGDDQDP